MDETAENGLSSLVCAPQMVHGVFWKNTFLTHFSPIWDPFFGPKTAHFQGILGFSKGQITSPHAQNGPRPLDWDPKWSTITFGNMCF